MPHQTTAAEAAGQDACQDVLDDARTTLARATAGYDAKFEGDLAAAIIAAITAASRLTDCDCVAVRTVETAGALLTVLATVLAMSPDVTRTPRAIRETVEELAKRLRRRVAAAEKSPDVAEMLRRSFRGDDVGGHA